MNEYPLLSNLCLPTLTQKGPSPFDVGSLLPLSLCLLLHVDSLSRPVKINNYIHTLIFVCVKLLTSHIGDHNLTLGSIPLDAIKQALG